MTSPAIVLLDFLGNHASSNYILAMYTRTAPHATVTVTRVNMGIVVAHVCCMQCITTVLVRQDIVG